MIKKIFSTMLLSLFVITLSVSGKEVKIKLIPESVADLKIYIRPLEKSSDAIRELSFDGALYAGEAIESQSGFYQLTGVKDNIQMFLYLYLPGGDVANIELKKEEKHLTANFDTDNSALSEYAMLELNVNRDIWSNNDVDSTKLSEYVNMCFDKAKNISGKGCGKEVQEFINIWSYSVAQNVENVISGQLRRAGKPMPKAPLFSSSQSFLDSDMAMFFPTSVTTILSALPRKASLIEKFEALYGNYTNTNVRQAVGKVLLNSFISKHDYNEDFEGGLEQLRVVTEKYDVDETILKEYEKRRSTIKGTPFPESVVLRDANGNTVDFSTFKGKYVYIDMWASWCGPCKREIPSLQKLEKELQNENVVFVSISVDSKEAAWKKAMTTFDMHGHQLIDTENAIGQALNVRGIPFFAIYDKEGRLYMHNAPRPSAGEPLKELLERLK